MKKNNVDNLVQLSREGDSAAFEILFSTFKSRLHNSLFKILRNFHETEDIVQQSFIRAWEKIETFKGNSNFYTWLYRIGFNLAITKINSSKEVQIDEGFESTLNSNENIIEDFETKELSQQVQQLLKQIPEEQRTAYVLCEIDDKNYDEIVKRSKDIFVKWRSIPAPQRGEYIRKFGEELRVNKDYLAETITKEARKNTEVFI